MTKQSEVVVDHGLAATRSPDDPEAFNAKTIEAIHAGRHAGRPV